MGHKLAVEVRRSVDEGVAVRIAEELLEGDAVGLVDEGNEKAVGSDVAQGIWIDEDHGAVVVLLVLDRGLVSERGPVRVDRKCRELKDHVDGDGMDGLDAYQRGRLYTGLVS